jgi:hypothetical protein
MSLSQMGVAIRFLNEWVVAPDLPNDLHHLLCLTLVKRHCSMRSYERQART